MEPKEREVHCAVLMRLTVRLGGLRRYIYLIAGAWRLRKGDCDRGLRLLSTGWGNQGFSADPEYLRAVLLYARGTTGPILECGSGLTSLVLAIVAPGRVWTLEHDERWCDKVVCGLSVVRAGERQVQLVSLKSYGEADWYSLPESLPYRFDLVVCDGPPGTTRGARSGIQLAIPERLEGAIILLDDAYRRPELELSRSFEAQGWVKSSNRVGKRHVTLVPPGREDFV
jgi:hypothetical protein